MSQPAAARIMNRVIERLVEAGRFPGEDLQCLGRVLALYHESNEQLSVSMGWLQRMPKRSSDGEYGRRVKHLAVLGVGPMTDLCERIYQHLDQEREADERVAMIALRDYAENLAKTIFCLVQIYHKLSQKEEGKGSYSLADWKADMKLYKDLIASQMDSAELFAGGMIAWQMADTSLQ